MQRKNTKDFLNKILALLGSVLMVGAAYARIPLWTFEPLTATTISVPANGSASVQYRVTNQSSRTHTLAMRSIRGVTQVTTSLGACGNPFVLRGKSSCILSLQINGSQLNSPIVDGPVVCQQGFNECYRPSAAHVLRITQTTPAMDAIITVTGSPLTLIADGFTGQLTINNTSTQITATNITSNFTGTALDGNVTETGNTCSNVAPGSSCTLTYTPGNTVIPQTNFTIQGTNTNTIAAAITVQSGSTLTSVNPSSGPASGGTGVILTGTGLTGATAVRFGGIPATGVTVVNSTTITAVTPAHGTGPVDVTIDTPTNVATLANGYTYLTSAIGQSAGGGVIACLNGGLNNLIAATTDNAAGIIAWGGAGFALGAGAQSDTDGASNTATIVTVLTSTFGIPANTYAAGLCSLYEIDSQGHSPCQAGNICYNDWFLPAGNNLTSSGQLNCLFANRTAIGGFMAAIYWSSTESSADPSNSAWRQSFASGTQSTNSKTNALGVRCVRNFTP